MRNLTTTLLILLTALFIVSGVGLVGDVQANHNHSNNTTTNNTTTTTTTSNNPFPVNTTNKSEETIGYWDGVWYNESFKFDNNPDAYLDNDNITKLTKRTIARIEVLRNDTFTEQPPVKILTRTQYQKQNVGYTPRNGSYKEWNNIVWKSLFIVDEDTNVEKELQKLYGGQVRAFYTPSQDTMYIIVSGNQTQLVKFDTTSLAHELTHAYQDQRFDLSRDKFNKNTQDGQLAKNSLIEGEAVYIETEFRERCQSGEWDCYMPRQSSSITSGDEINIGLQMTAYFPYSDGHAYVRNLVKEDGWSAVDKKYSEIPTHTSQIIHYNTPVSTTTPDITDNSDVEWRQYSYGNRGSERVGEATLAIMFWYQNYQYGIDTGISNSDVMSSADASRYDYNHEITSGLTGDIIQPYYNEQEVNETGYIFKTKWDSFQDVNQFKNAYITMIQGHRAKEHNTELNGRVFVLPNSSGYTGVYYVNATNNTVTITHSSTLENVREIQGIEGSSEVVKQNKNNYEKHLQNIPTTNVLLLLIIAILFIIALVKSIK